MKKKSYVMILLVSIATVSCAMDKKINYVIYQKLDHGSVVTKIDFFRAHEDSDKPEKLIKTIYLDENQTQAFMQLAGQAKELKAWRAWNTKWNAARL